MVETWIVERFDLGRDAAVDSSTEVGDHLDHLRERLSRCIGSLVKKKIGKRGTERIMSCEPI